MNDLVRNDLVKRLRLRPEREMLYIDGCVAAGYGPTIEAQAATEIERLANEVEKLKADREVACTALCPHGLDIASQKENAERRLREYEHMVMTGRNDQHDRLVAERDALQVAYNDLLSAHNKMLDAIRSLLT